MKKKEDKENQGKEEKESTKTCCKSRARVSERIWPAMDDLQPSSSHEDGIQAPNCSVWCVRSLCYGAIQLSQLTAWCAVVCGV